MSAEELLPDVLRDNGNDHLTASAKAVLGAVPFAGSLLAELAGVAIPNQRIDRVSRFAAELDRRLAGVEEEIVKKKWDEDEFLDLAEEVVRQAARATSEERIQYLALVLVKAMTDESVKDNERRHLLRILGDINDVEVVWLAHYASVYVQGIDKFRDTHGEILEQKTYAEFDSDRARLQWSAMRDSYKYHLLNLGLLERELRVNRDNSPEIDHVSRDFRYNYSVSTLGLLLLEMIGFVIRSRLG